jgi:hypothetical protein
VADAARRPSGEFRNEVGDDERGPSRAGLPDGEDDAGLLEPRDLADSPGSMSRLGSSPIVARGARSGTALRNEDRLDPADGSREGTVDSVVPAGSPMDGSEDNDRDGETGAGWLMTAPEPEPQLVHGAETAAGAV